MSNYHKIDSDLNFQHTVTHDSNQGGKSTINLFINKMNSELPTHMVLCLLFLSGELQTVPNK